MENHNIKKSIDCYLELYIKEVSLLREKALKLYSDLISKPPNYWRDNPNELIYINSKINRIKRREAALIECKNESIVNI